MAKMLQHLLSKRIQSLSESPTLALDGLVKNIQKSGQKVHNLTLGEPDFVTPLNIQKAGKSAITSGFTHYTQASGIPELKKAICRKLEKENSVSYSPDQIIVGPGTKFLLFEAFQSLLEIGDEVLLSTPTWSTYVEQIRLSGGKPVLIPLKPPFKLTEELIAKHMSKRTKVLLLNYPANPTGSMIEKEELKKLLRLVKKHKIFIVSDEIYEKITYGTKFVSLASLDQSMKDQILTINGFSKAYAMTGWRLGYAAGPRELIQAMSKLQSQTTSNPSSIAQFAAVEALLGPQNSISDMSREFAKRREFLLQEFKKIPSLSVTEPEGAFYLFVSVEKHLSKRLPTSSAWCQALLEKELVAVVPGEAFLYPGNFRLSFAASLDTLKESVYRIRRFCHA